MFHFIVFTSILFSSAFAFTNGKDVAMHEVNLATDNSKVRAYIENANAEINRLIKKGAFEQAGQYFAPDVIQIVTGQEPIIGRDAWIAFQQNAAQIGAWDLQLEVIDLEVREDIAVERGRGVSTFTANQNSPMPSFTSIGDYVVLWKKNGDDWQIHWDYVVIQPPQ